MTHLPPDLLTQQQYDILLLLQTADCEGRSRVELLSAVGNDYQAFKGAIDPLIAAGIVIQHFCEESQRFTIAPTETGEELTARFPKGSLCESHRLSQISRQ